MYFQIGLSCDIHYDSAAFLYSLVNYPAGWQPVKLDQIGKASIFPCPTYGPTFGGGGDIFITDKAGSFANSYSNLGYTYSPPSGYGAGSSFAKSFLAGSFRFQPDEVEVFYKTA